MHWALRQPRAKPGRIVAKMNALTDEALMLAVGARGVSQGVRST
jgi:polyphosphate kinase